MKKNTINLEKICTPESINLVNVLVSNYGICQAFTSINDEIAICKANIEKNKASVKLLIAKLEAKTTPADELNELNTKKEKAVFALEKSKEKLTVIESRKKDIYLEVLKFVDKDGVAFSTENIILQFEEDKITYSDIQEICENAVAHYESIFNSLHFVDKRTIEILSALMYNVSLAIPNTVKDALDRYYAYVVNHMTDKASKEYTELKKIVRESIQHYVNSNSIIYNADRTSEGLFIPQHLNINASDNEMFIASYFKGTKIDNNNGMSYGAYGNKKTVVNELNKLMLCKFQGIAYGTPKPKKEK